MKKMIRLIIYFSLIIPLVCVQEYDYSNHSFARLSYITGDTYIQNASDLAYEEGRLNMPIREGDRIGTTEGRAEINIGNGTYLRLDNHTKLDFLNIPKQKNDLTKVRLWTGNIYFSIRDLEKEKNIEIDTSDVSVYILDKGQYRIDIRENTEVDIFVFKGIAEIATESGSALLKESQKMEIVQSQLSSRPINLNTASEDGFDRWSEYRDSQYRKKIANSYLPEESKDSIKFYPHDKNLNKLNIRKIKKKTNYPSRYPTRNRSVVSLNRFYSSITRKSRKTYKTRDKNWLLRNRSRLSNPPVMRRPKSSAANTSKVKKKKK